MEYAAFNPQLSDTDLAELGRLTVNFGYIELLLDWLLLAAFNVRNQEAIRLLITPLPLKRKAEMLIAQLPNCPKADATAAMEEGLKLAEDANNDRNQIIHGYWALKNGVGMMAYYRKDPNKSRVMAPSVGEIADKAALASRHLYRAYNLLNGTPMVEQTGPDVLAPMDGGGFQVLTRSAKRPPPPPDAR